jgi:hypothetical protein
MNKVIIRLENLCVFGICLLIYFLYDLSWKEFLIYFFVPDAFLCGYLINKRIGAITYNFSHNYIFPLLISCITIYTGNDKLLSLSLILCAHIGFDRMLGFGLKYPKKEFFDTHLQRL